MEEKIFIIIPTFNEEKNIEFLIEKIFSIDSNFHIIIIDSSTDNTESIIKNLCKKFSNLHLIRLNYKGRGIAGMKGFKYALENNANYIIEMDADLSHDPKYIPLLLEKVKNYDVIVASRMLEGGKDERNYFRRFLTKLANFYIRLILGIETKDVTSGFRCFNRKTLESINLDKLKSKGPSIVTEVLYQCILRNAKVCEIPFIFKKRKHGKSKLKIGTLLKYPFLVIKFRL